MEHGIRFSTLSVFRTNYIVPGALHTIRSRFLPFVHFFASSSPFNVLNLIVFVLIRLLNSPFTAFFFTQISILNVHSISWTRTMNEHIKWALNGKKDPGEYTSLHIKWIQFHFISFSRFAWYAQEIQMRMDIFPEKLNAHACLYTRRTNERTTDSICMHHSVTTDARWENFHSNGRKEVVRCRRYSMHNRLKSVLLILRTIALLSSGSYRDKVRWLFSIATFSAVRFVTCPISIDPIAQFHFTPLAWNLR